MDAQELRTRLIKIADTTVFSLDEIVKITEGIALLSQAKYMSPTRLLDIVKVLGENEKDRDETKEWSLCD